MHVLTSPWITITLAYWLAGHLALGLAIPPGYTAPFFPSAGIALAALIICGLRYWPAVLAGSALVQLAAAWPLIKAPRTGARSGHARAGGGHPAGRGRRPARAQADRLPQCARYAIGLRRPAAGDRRSGERAGELHDRRVGAGVGRRDSARERALQRLVVVGVA